MSQKNSPLFSIIVPVYNVQAYLPACLESVAAQTLQDYELILVDDGSTDQSSKICDEYVKKQPQPSIIAQNSEKVNTKSATLPKIHVIHQKNQGLSTARNAGVQQASGEYLIFLDGDDYLESTALSAIKSGLEPGLDLLRYQAQEVFPDGRTVKYRESGFDTMSGIAAFSHLAHYHYTENAWLYAYRTAFFRKHDFQYAEGCVAEDLGLTPLIIAEAKSVKSISDICYSYRQRSGSIMHSTDKTKRRASDILKQLRVILPKIAALSGARPIAHYLVVSYLTETTALGEQDFLKTYREAQEAGFLSYVQPSSLRAFPRSFLLKHCPRLFYRLYSMV